MLYREQWKKILPADTFHTNDPFPASLYVSREYVTLNMEHCHEWMEILLCVNICIFKVRNVAQKNETKNLT